MLLGAGLKKIKSNSIWWVKRLENWGQTSSGHGEEWSISKKEAVDLAAPIPLPPVQGQSKDLSLERSCWNTCCSTFMDILNTFQGFPFMWLWCNDDDQLRVLWAGWGDCSHLYPIFSLRIEVLEDQLLSCKCPYCTISPIPVTTHVMPWNSLRFGPKPSSLQMESAAGTKAEHLKIGDVRSEHSPLLWMWQSGSPCALATVMNCIRSSS